MVRFFVLFGLLTISAFARKMYAQESEEETCQCEYGDLWCASNGYLNVTFNCSGTPEGKALWKTITDQEMNDATDKESCEKLQQVCVSQPQLKANDTCVRGCHNWCWIQDVGDCADDDDSQIFCVHECMKYCTTERRCGDAGPETWTPCEKQCGENFMESNDINFIEYSMCMADCTPVPIY